MKTKLDAQAEEARKLENGQKIILGGFFLHELRTNPKTRDWFLKEWEAKISRENDQKRLAPLLEELRKMAAPVLPATIPPSASILADRKEALESMTINDRG